MLQLKLQLHILYYVQLYISTVPITYFSRTQLDKIAIYNYNYELCTATHERTMHPIYTNAMSTAHSCGGKPIAIFCTNTYSYINHIQEYVLYCTT